MLALFQSQNTPAAPTAQLLLRDLFARVPAGAPEAGNVVAGSLFDGVSGADIIAATTGGDVGPGIFGDTVLDPLKGYRLLVTSSTGTFGIYDNGAGYFSTDWSATLNVYEDNLLIGTTTQGGVMVTPPLVGVLPGLVAARSLPTIAATYGPPGALGVLPGLTASRTLQDIAASYSGPVYSAVLPGLVAGASVPSFAGGYGTLSYGSVVQPLASARLVPGIAAAYSPPNYTATVQGMVMVPMLGNVLGSVYVEGWKRALKEDTLLAPVDQIDNLGGFAEKAPQGRKTVAFEFKRFSPAPLSAEITLAQVRGPADPAAQSVLEGLPSIVGTRVYQRVKQGLADCDYKLTCLMVDESGAAYVLTGVLPVRSR